MITKNIKEQTRYFEEIAKHKYKCKNCGHTVIIFPMEHKIKKLCKWCGEYVYINGKEEFKDRMRGKLK